MCKLVRLIFTLAVLAFCSGRGEAAFLLTYERGWYSGGNHQPINDNYITGVGTYNSFFAFDLTGVNGLITSAQLQLLNPSTGYAGASPSELLTIYDYTSSISDLTAGTAGVAGYNDLGSGTFFGTKTVSAADNGTFVTVSLNANGLSALNAARGGAGKSYSEAV